MSVDFSLVVVHRLLIAVASSVAEHGLYDVWASLVAASGLTSCSSQTLAHRHMCLVAPQHVGSSQIRDRTHVSCIGRQILYH